MSKLCPVVDIKAAHDSLFVSAERGKEFNLVSAYNERNYLVESLQTGKRGLLPSILSNRPPQFDLNKEDDLSPLERVTINLSSGNDPFSEFWESFYRSGLGMICGGHLYVVERGGRETRAEYELYFDSLRIRGRTGNQFKIPLARIAGCRAVPAAADGSVYWSIVVKSDEALQIWNLHLDRKERFIVDVVHTIRDIIPQLLISGPKISSHIQKAIVRRDVRLPHAVVALLSTKLVALENPDGAKTPIALTEDFDAVRISHVSCNEDGEFLLHPVSGDPIGMSKVLIFLPFLEAGYSDTLSKRTMEALAGIYGLEGRALSICDFPFPVRLRGTCIQTNTKKTLAYWLEGGANVLCFYEVNQKVYLRRQAFSFPLVDLVEVIIKATGELKLIRRDGKKITISSHPQNFLDDLLLFRDLSRVSVRKQFPPRSDVKLVAKRRNFLWNLLRNVMKYVSSPGWEISNYSHILGISVANEIYYHILRLLARLTYPDMGSKESVALISQGNSMEKFMKIVGADDSHYFLKAADSFEEKTYKSKKYEATRIVPAPAEFVFSAMEAGQEEEGMIPLTYSEFYKKAQRISSQEFGGFLTLRLRERGKKTFYFRVLDGFFGYFSDKDSFHPLFAVSTADIRSAKRYKKRRIVINFESAGWPDMVLSAPSEQVADEWMRILSFPKVRSKPNFPKELDFLNRAYPKVAFDEREVLWFLEGENYIDVAPCPYAYTEEQSALFIDYQILEESSRKNSRVVPVTVALTCGWSVLLLDDEFAEICRFPVSHIVDITYSEHIFADTEVFWTTSPEPFPTTYDPSLRKHLSRTYFGQETSLYSLNIYLSGGRRYDKVTLGFKSFRVYSVWKFLICSAKQLCGKIREPSPAGEKIETVDVMKPLADIYTIHNHRDNTRRDIAGYWLGRIASKLVRKVRRLNLTTLEFDDYSEFVVNPDDDTPYDSYIVYCVGLVDRPEKFRVLEMHWDVSMDLLNWPVFAEFSCKGSSPDFRTAAIISWVFVVRDSSGRVCHTSDLRVPSYKLLDDQNSIEFSDGTRVEVENIEEYGRLVDALFLISQYSDILTESQSNGSTNSILLASIGLINTLEKSGRFREHAELWSRRLVSVILQTKFRLSTIQADSKQDLDTGRILMECEFAYTRSSALFHIYDVQNRTVYTYSSGRFSKSFHANLGDSAIRIPLNVRIFDAERGLVKLESDLVKFEDLVRAQKILLSLRNGEQDRTRRYRHLTKDEVTSTMISEMMDYLKLHDLPFVFETGNCSVLLRKQFVGVLIRLEGHVLVMSAGDSSLRLDLLDGWDVTQPQSSTAPDGKHSAIVVLVSTQPRTFQDTPVIKDGRIHISFGDSAAATEFLKVAEGIRVLDYLVHRGWKSRSTASDVSENLGRCIAWVNEFCSEFISQRIAVLEGLSSKGAEVDTEIRMTGDAIEGLTSLKAYRDSLCLWMERAISMLIVTTNGMNLGDMRTRCYSKRPLHVSSGDVTVPASTSFLFWEDCHGQVIGFYDGKEFPLSDPGICPTDYIYVSPMLAMYKVLGSDQYDDGDDSLVYRNENSSAEDLLLLRWLISTYKQVRQFIINVTAYGMTEDIVTSALRVFSSVMAGTEYLENLVRIEVRHAKSAQDLFEAGGSIESVIRELLSNGVPRSVLVTLLGEPLRGLFGDRISADEFVSILFDRLVGSFDMFPRLLWYVLGVTARISEGKFDGSSRIVVVKILFRMFLVPWMETLEGDRMFQDIPGAFRKRKLMEVLKILRDTVGTVVLTPGQGVERPGRVQAIVDTIFGTTKMPTKNSPDTSGVPWGHKEIDRVMQEVLSKSIHNIEEDLGTLYRALNQKALRKEMYEACDVCTQKVLTALFYNYR